MKRRDLEKVVEKHLAHIQKFSQQIPGHFVPEDIHELRVEYKKLRAFTRLVQLERGAGDLRILPKLKSLYHAAGEVRDIQHLLQQLATISGKYPLPEFIKYWEQVLFAAKEQLVKEIEKADFGKMQENMSQHLPDTLEENTIEKFIHRKVAAIHIILMAAEQDKDLHSIRKNLKDIIYEIRIFKSDLGLPFPVKAWKSEKLLNDMTVKLGDFNDQSILISYLHSGYSKIVSAGEQTIIDNWRQSLELQKEKLKQFLFQQVLRLQLVHDFQSI